MLVVSFCILACLQAISAKTFYVDSKTTKTRQIGTSRAPFSTIQDCVDAVKSPGDVCQIKAGRYHEDVVITGKHGTKNKPIIITGFREDRPYLDGSVFIQAKSWSKISPTSNIYSACYNARKFKKVGKLHYKVSMGWEYARINDSYISARIDADISQLFVDGEMMTNARWPNSLWSNRTIFNGSYWSKVDSATKPGIMVNKGDSLANTSIDMTGAMAVMNIGSFNTFVAKVESHTAGSNSFTYHDTFKNKHFIAKNSRYFLEDKLELLDQAEEWYYNKTTKMLYVWTKDGDSPAKHELRGKVQTYAIKIWNSSNLVVKDLDFFATTLLAESVDVNNNNIDELTFQSLNFKYPSYSKRMLGDPAPPQWTKISAYARYKKIKKYGTFQIHNCTFFGTDGVALEFTGMNTTVKNNLFLYNDWTGANMATFTGGKGTIVSNGISDHFVRNTLGYNGATSGYRPGLRSRIELNHVYKQCWGIIMNDGSGIHLTVPKQPGSLALQNWVHSSPKYGLRFDGEPPKIGENGTFTKNVVFKCNGLMVKGDNHKVYNNLAFDKQNGKDSDKQGAGCTLCVLKYVRKNPGMINNDTVVIANVADVANGGRTGKVTWPLAGKVHKRNVFGNVRNELMDPDNFDFRPRSGSKYIPLGAGPYTYDPKMIVYWIPGRQMYKASSPVPPNQGQNVKAANRNALMWLNAIGASSHDVYFGDDYKKVHDAVGKIGKEYLGSTTTEEQNVIYLKSRLGGKQSYYWRVDAIVPSVGLYKGDVWTFTTN
eukprot:gene3512-4013_t